MLVLELTHDCIWVARDRRPTGEKVVGSFYYEGNGWWRGCLASGLGKALWVSPDCEGPEREVARRLFR
jgi:hypothetical protein